jgi:ATP-dependent Clp protease protease subunit
MKRTSDTNNIVEEVHDFCIDVTNRQIYLHDSVKEEGEDLDFRVATRFIKNMAMLQSTDGAIVVHLFSHGGDIDAGFAIYDCIKTSNCHISVVCHGACMSMASVILQAADERVSMPNCEFMLHEGSSGMAGTHKQNKVWQDAFTHARDRIMNIYVDSAQEHGNVFMGKTAKQVRNYIQGTFDKKEDWILTPEEALSHGFIDRILGEKEFKNFVQRN